MSSEGVLENVNRFELAVRKFDNNFSRVVLFKPKMCRTIKYEKYIYIYEIRF